MRPNTPMHQTGAIVLKELIVFVRSQVPCNVHHFGRSLMGRLQVMGRSVMRTVRRAGDSAEGAQLRRLTLLVLAAPALPACAPSTSANPRAIEVSVAVEGATLRGTLELPGGPGPFPAILLVPGSAAFDRSELGAFD